MTPAIPTVGRIDVGNSSNLSIEMIFKSGRR